MKIKCNGQDILSNNFTDKDKRKLDSVQPCANYYKHPIRDGYKHLPAGGQEGQAVIHDGTNATWKYPLELIPNIDDLLAYGVQFNSGIADPHLTRIGNLSMHKTLPIQSQLKGCIAQGGEVRYWLDKDDWRFREDHMTIPKDSYMRPTLSIAEGIYTIKCVALAEHLNQYKKQWIKINSVICQIDEINYGNNTATLVYNEKLATLKEGLVDLELGSVLNGYDGTVRVYCPEFYIKFTVEDTIYKVLISSVKINDTYIKQPAILIDAYKSTILNTVPEGMGYLSTLPVNSAVSIVNNNTYCRGGENRSDYDIYLETDPFRTDLGKPITHLLRSDMRTYSRNADSEMLSYDQYKNIFYWLYVIEYANFNCQETFNEELTTEGFKQGGLGEGITTWNRDASDKYNKYNPLTPCGYGNILGNNTGLIPLTIPETVYKATSIPVDTYTKNTDRANIVNSTNNGVTITKVIENDMVLYAQSTKIFGKTTYEINGLTDGQTISFEQWQGNKYVIIATASTDGPITVNWGNPGSYYRNIIMGKVQDECNITIYTSSIGVYQETIPQHNMQMPRWRGFDNPFGDINNCFDGIIADYSSSYYRYIFICKDANNYSDSINNSYKRLEAPYKQGYIKAFQRKDAHIIPFQVGGDSTKYMCDLYKSSDYTTSKYLFTINFGGNCYSNSAAGLCCQTFEGIIYKMYACFRTVSNFIPSNN